jgi:fumarate reductase flavoprotein subunit
MQCDVAVIGGGIAGMTTANRAAQLGLKVCVLEAGSAEKYFCNTRFTGGTFHLCRQDIMAGETAVRAYMTAEVGNVATSETIEAMVEGAPKVIGWLREEGIRFIKASGSAYHNWVLAPPGRARTALDWEGRSGDVLLMTLEKNLKGRGGTIVRGARATALIVEEGHVLGVEANTASGVQRVHALAVVIADGGFQGNADYVGRYVTRHPERLRQRGAGTGVGDGLTMASEIGAATSDLSRFYGHLLSIDALTNDNLWPYPYLDSIVSASLVVGPDGHRFADEGHGGVYMANAVARLPDPTSAAVIFDAAIWDGAGRAGLIAANPNLTIEGGTLHSADTIEALAEKLNIEPAELVKTVQAHNRACLNGGLGSLSPARSGSSAYPIVKAPFHAAPMCVGITYTMGGVLTDADARVLHRSGGVISGLYAVGATVGGIEGGPDVGYVGGLARSAIFGLRAASTIAEAQGRRCT